MTTDKSTEHEVISELRSMVEPRLLDGTWPIPVDEIPGLDKRFVELGLLAPDGVTTALGDEINQDLWSGAFIGAHWIAESRSTSRRSAWSLRPLTTRRRAETRT